MGVNLTIDMGNTATKMTMWRGDTMLVSATATADLALAVTTFIAAADVDAAIISSVTDHESLDAVTEAVKSRVSRVITLDASTPLPLRNGYQHPETLGLDRLAAAVGAAALLPHRSILVADLGTAATYDAVSPSGEFCGGVIAPGLKMRLDALHRFTSRLPELPVPSAGHPIPAFPPRNTADAMTLGATGGIVAEISHFLSAMHPATQVVLTGGDAPVIAPLLKSQPIVDAHLVGRGLNSILFYNEK